MRDIPEFAVRSFSTRHRDKKPLGPFYHFHIMYHKFTIEGDRGHGFHFAIRRHAPQSNVCHFHAIPPPYESGHVSMADIRTNRRRLLPIVEILDTI